MADENATIAKAFNAQRTPECFLFDNKGKLVYQEALNDNPASPETVSREHLKIAINEMTAGNDVSVNTTKSTGCLNKKPD